VGYSGKLEDKLKVQSLRKQGYSYKEILEQVTVSKDTISRWCKDIELSEEQKKRLIQNKQFGQKKGSLVAADNKRRHRIEQTDLIRKTAKEELGDISDRDKLLLGIALYAGEGYKMDRKVGFANADPQLIKFMMEWFLTVTKTPMSRIRGAIWLHDNLDEQLAKAYWSTLTGIPQNQFHKTYMAKLKPDSKKIRKNIHPYGVFAIRFTDSATHRRIMGWIYGIFNDKIAKRLPE
jgi:transcriptional regulator with XRE-family HTH domain